MDWQAANEWERQWWANAGNTFNEEAKQYVYAKHMGLTEFATNWYGRRGWDFGDLRVIDIGGGPCSLLLKSKAARRVVVDPCAFPNWVKVRYQECGIQFWQKKGEAPFLPGEFDLALIYNCLQHTEDPELLIRCVKVIVRELRIFEWVDTGTSEGHLHNLTAAMLDEWIGGQGCVRQINESPCVGKAYFGVFPF